MSIIRIKGFKVFKDRHGRQRCYHRKTGVAIDLNKSPMGSAEYIAECERIAVVSTVKLPKGGSLGKPINDYRPHDAFKDLATQTRSDYQQVFDYLKPIADTPLVKFDKPLVVRIRDKASVKGRRFAKYVKAIFSIIFGWESERGCIKHNAAAGIKDIRRKGMPEANRAWSDEERHAALAAMPPQMLPAFVLMTFTGLGPKDALELPRPFYKGGEIATRRAKTGEPVFWPAPKALVEILDKAPKHDAFTYAPTWAGCHGRWAASGILAESAYPAREE